MTPFKLTEELLTEIEQLIEKVATTVEQVHSIRLQREVHIIGEALDQQGEG